MKYGDVFNGGVYLRIKRMELKDKLTITRLSELLEVSSGNISKIELQNHRPKQRLLKKWLEILNIDEEEAKKESSDIKDILEFDEEADRLRRAEISQINKKSRAKLIPSSQFDGGAVLKMERIKIGYNQIELADKLKEPVWKIRQVENNSYRPNKELLKKWLSCLNVNIQEAVEKSGSIREILN